MIRIRLLDLLCAAAVLAVGYAYVSMVFDAMVLSVELGAR